MGTRLREGQSLLNTADASNAYDLLIVGGGINGAGIARDAAGRGLSVVLCERDDLASGTSSASSKLIHGGLRYLEHYEFRLVREALNEREVLLSIAPHITWPMTFVLPHHAGLRPAWMIRLGLWLYDHLGRRRMLQGTRRLDLRRAPEGDPLDPALKTGFAYSDAWVDDARLVVLNAQDAKQHGAHIMTRTELIAAERQAGSWRVRLRDNRTGTESTLTSRALVNAAGPWVEDLINRIDGVSSRHAVRLVKGSHIVVPKLYDGAQAYILQNADKRVVFVLPYEAEFSLIGTTDVDHEGGADRPVISDGETEYLCDTVNDYFRVGIEPSDVVWSYAGFRPLFDDGGGDPSSVTRDYTLDLQDDGGMAPLLSVYGGKITTYRELAEKALTQLAGHLTFNDTPWTATRRLPGGDFDRNGDATAFDIVVREFPWLPRDLAVRYARQYGTRTIALVGDAGSVADLGTHLGAGLYQREVSYLARHEWAETAEDVLWRRTKLGLRMTKSDVNHFEEWLGGGIPAL